MKTIQRSYLLFSILLFTQQNIDAQKKKGKWIQRDVTIEYAEEINSYLLTNANTISYISNADGKHARLGRYLFIKNNSADTIFYRSSPAGLGDYIKRDAIFFTATTSNMLQYYPVLPGHSDLIDCNSYEDSHLRTISMKLIVDFKYFRPDSLSKKPIQKATSQPPTSSNTASSSQNTASPPAANNFYIFLSTRLDVPPAPGQFSSLQSSKILEIISKPMLHTGKLTDDLVREKETFLDDLEKHHQTDNIELRKQLSANNYQRITIHYGKPYSTTLLKTEQAGIEAIAAFMQSERELVSGIASIEFINLNK